VLPPSESGVTPGFETEFDSAWTWSCFVGEVYCYWGWLS